MSEWTSRFDTNHRGAVSDDQVDELMDQLAPHHGTLGASLLSHLAITISYPAEDLRQALVTGEAIVTRALEAAGLTCQLTAGEVMTSAEFDQRQGMEPLPELLSVTQAASVMGITGARVRQLLDAGQLVGAKIGATWAVPKRVAEARAALGRFKDTRDEAAALSEAVADAGKAEARNEARMAAAAEGRPQPAEVHDYR